MTYRLAQLGVALDTETALIAKGNLAPELICGSVAFGSTTELMLPDKTLEVAQIVLKDRIFIAANAPFDLLVLAVYARTKGIDLMPEIFKAYREERVFDILLAQQLHALAHGVLGCDPRTGGMLRSPSTGAMAGYGLEVVTDLVLGRTNAKVNDKWRMSYYLLKDTPLEQWPEDARNYPLDDALNTYEVALAQVGHDNLFDLPRQCMADWCLHLGAAWGFTVDLDSINELEVLTRNRKASGEDRFLKAGLLKRVGEKIKKHTRNFKTTIAKAYGATGKCKKCDGLGLIAGTTKCIKACIGTECPRCFGLGFKPKTCKSTEVILKDSKGDQINLDGFKTDVPVYVNVLGCDGTGLDLESVPMPRTPKGGVGGGRDELYESGDDLLIEFAAWGEQDKILNTYIPWLRKGIDVDGLPIPLNPRPKVLKETGRIGGSTEDQLPREGGVRECIVSRKGWVLGSCDWEGAELIAHAQNCYTMVGMSRMGDALNGGVKVHDKLAAEILGVEYGYMVDNRKTDKHLGNARQAAKPPNFGFPGLMGATTLVLQQRRQGPDTTSQDGRLYKGLRFCILAGGESVCGHTKVTEWNKRIIPPTCVVCIQTAEQLKKVWLETWPENVEYFKLIKKIYDSGSMTQTYSNRIRGGASLCATANGLFQGLIGDAIKEVVCSISEEMYVVKSSDLYGVRMIKPLHDEIIFEAREEQASAAALRISEIMVEVLGRICPDLSGAIVAEPALMRRLNKNAAPVWDGKTLIPWEG